MSKQRDVESLFSNLNRAGEQAQKSSPVAPSKAESVSSPPTPAKQKKSHTAKKRASESKKNLVLARGEVGIGEFGANKCNYRITRPIDQWIREHTQGNKNLTFNWLLELGMKQAEKMLKDSEVRVLPDDLTPLDEG